MVLMKTSAFRFHAENCEVMKKLYRKFNWKICLKNVEILYF